MAVNQQCVCVGGGNEATAECINCNGTGIVYYCEGCEQWLPAHKFEDPEEQFLCVDCMEEEEANFQ